MIENVLQYDEKLSTLTIKDKSYKLDHNVYVVGFGKAVMGMARAVEQILGDHIVSGILSVPRGQTESLQQKGRGDLLLQPETKIRIYEGGQKNLPDEVAHQAALDIQELVSNKKDTDLIIALISGGGSPLLPSPRPPISLEDLIILTKELTSHGAPMRDINVIRKHIEVLKGGGLGMAARPAQVASLILSDIIGDPLNLIASAPTVYDQVPARQCMEVINRMHLSEKIPQSIIDHLQKQVTEETAKVAYRKPAATFTLGTGYESQTGEQSWVQNVLVGSNTQACQAAVHRAKELGYLPFILTTELEGEARDIGKMLGKLGVFMLMCFDRKLSRHATIPTLRLELDLVQEGISKIQINEIVNLVDNAYNMGKGVVIISGGETVVNVKGKGKGGRNQELALAASLKLCELLKLTTPRPVADITLLSADTDGEDGSCPAAGAVINENFAVEAAANGFLCEKHLDDNDSYTLMSSVKKGSHLVVTGKTGTNVMDIQILIVRCPTSPLK
nr:hypothetical protein BaRGS_001986 [Batillaria attramentaria]